VLSGRKSDAGCFSLTIVAYEQQEAVVMTEDRGPPMVHDDQSFFQALNI
jgi:hypothetical protein